MTDRAVSTVLDVGLCLILVAAAVVTVTSVHVPNPDPAARAAGETATMLATSTATVSYSLSDAAEDTVEPEFRRTSGPEFERREHGTLASLLAEAAMANLSHEGRQISGLGDAFGEAVREEVSPLLSGPGWRGQVVARWSPYPGSDLQGTSRIGPSPPPGTEVHVATLTLSSGIHEHEMSVEHAGESGFTELAQAVARGIVWSRFPPARTRQALRGAYPEPGLTELRYAGLARRYGADVGSQVEATEPGDANGRLAAAMADELYTGLRRRFDSPVEAAAAVDITTVTVVVRTWSA